MSELTFSEISALRYYIGDVTGSDAFYGDPKAYVTLNSLFFPEIATERARAAEGKFLNTAMISDTERLLGFFAELFSAFRKRRAETDQHTFRVERYSDYCLANERGATVSLTSTSKAGFLREYRDRLGIALMKFCISAGTPCIDVAAELDCYAKSEEAEILLPPFVELNISKIHITGDELGVLDSAGEPPRVSSSIITGGIVPCEEEAAELPYAGSAAGQRVFTCLNAGTEPEKSDIELYTAWKAALVQKLHKML